MAEETVMDWKSAQANWQQLRCEVHAKARKRQPRPVSFC